MIRKKDNFKNLIGWKIGDGKNIDFWNDLWIPYKRLSDFANNQVSALLQLQVSLIMEIGTWMNSKKFFLKS